MRLTITITSEIYGLHEDVMIDPHQEINETIRILYEAGYMKKAPDRGCRVRSERKGFVICKHHTYEEEKIWYGDVLTIL